MSAAEKWRDVLAILALVVLGALMLRCGGSAFTTADPPDALSSDPPDAALPTASLEGSTTSTDASSSPGTSETYPVTRPEAGAPSFDAPSEAPAWSRESGSDGSGEGSPATTDAPLDVLEHDAGDGDAAKPTQICETNDTLTCQSPFFYTCQGGQLCCEQPCNQ